MGKQKKLCVLAILIAFLALAYVSSISTTSTNQTVGVEWILNTTNLAPSFPGEPVGTNERVDNVTYWANSTPIEIHAWAHANSANSTAGVFLYINNTLYSPRAGRPLGSAETAYRGVDTTIPKGSYYRVDFQNYHHYEWRETPIITGNITSNMTDDDSAYVQKSGSTWTGNMIMDGTTITTNTVLDKDAYIYEDSILPTVRLRARNVSTYGYFELFPYYADILVSGRRYNFSNASLDIGNASLINCSNCANQTLLNEKVSKSGDFLNGSLHNTTAGINDSIDLTNSQVVIRSQNTTSLYAGDFVLTPDEIDIEIHDGFTNLLKIISDKTSIEIGGVTEFSVNNSTINLGNNNITNCANCVSRINYDLNYTNLYNTSRDWNITYTNTEPYPITLTVQTRVVNSVASTPSNFISFKLNGTTFILNSNDQAGSNDITIYHIIPSGANYSISNTTRSGTPGFAIFSWYEGKLELI